MIQMRVEGGEQLARKFAEISDRVSKSMLREALREVAEPIRAQASSKAPRAPGAPDLAEHIVVSTGRSKGSLSAAVVVGPSNESRSDQPSRSYDRQGLYVEFGTSRTHAQPFLRPSFDAEAPRAIGKFAAAAWTAIAKGLGGSRGTSSGGGLL